MKKKKKRKSPTDAVASVRKKRKGRGAHKGSRWERELCKRFSLWWTLGERDDCFWRTSQSGGRATQRSKKNKTTVNQYGDMAATDAVGQSLIDLLTFEFKRGYNSATIQDLLDKPKTGKPSVYEKWIDKAMEDCIAAGSRS